jgi:signal peptidase I
MKYYKVKKFNTPSYGQPTRSFLNDLGTLLFLFAIAVFLVFIDFSNLYTGMAVRGPSMMPTYNSDYIDHPEKEDIVYYTPVENNEYKRGDIVIAKASDDKDIIKRVIGLPGDLIEIKYDIDYYYVFINGVKLEEDYILSQKDMAIEHDKFYHLFDRELVVPDNCLFILGDNRGNSNDSTFYGCFNYSDILGRVDYTVKAGNIPLINLFVQLFLPKLYNA